MFLLVVIICNNRKLNEIVLFEMIAEVGENGIEKEDGAVYQQIEQDIASDRINNSTKATYKSKITAWQKWMEQKHPYCVNAETKIKFYFH